jgi:transcription initiation factor TFIIB
MGDVAKTKKVKRGARQDKKALWARFSKEVEKEPDKPVECVYGESKGREKCDCCGAAIAITDEGFQACTSSSCGVLYRDVMDQGAEWRYYGAEDSHGGDPTRCGLPINPLLKESSFGCKVLCAGGSTYEMRKIRKYTEWQSMPYREKSQYDEFQRITIQGTQAGIPRMIIDDAMRYHKKISEVRTFRGCNRDGIIAASIYVAARLNDCPRTPKEIAEIFHLDSGSATKGCKNAIQIINELEGDMAASDKTTLCETTPGAFIQRYCSKLQMNDELTKICSFIAMRIQKHNLIPENTPHSIAAGIVYFVSQLCNANLTKRHVHSISDISEVTINKCFKKLESMKANLVPAAILARYQKSDD